MTDIGDDSTEKAFKPVKRIIVSPKFWWAQVSAYAWLAIPICIRSFVFEASSKHRLASVLSAVVFNFLVLRSVLFVDGWSEFPGIK
jgi:hypothetical protein